MHVLAGVEGFEPPNDGFRVHCLTTWRHPIGKRMGEAYKKVLNRSIDPLAMTDFNNLNQELILTDLIKNPVRPNPIRPNPFIFSFQGFSRKRILPNRH